MTRDDALQYCKSQPPTFLTRANDISGRPSYICPVCGNGGGESHTGLQQDPHRAGKYHCHKCGFDGDILDLYRAAKDISDTREACSSLYAHYNIDVDDSPPKGAPLAWDATIGTDDSRPEASDGITDARAVEYLTARGISVDTARRCGVRFCADTGQGHAGIILTNHAGGQDIRGLENDYKRKQGASTWGLYPAAHPDANAPVWAVEGGFDALTVSQAGQTAISLNGVNNWRQLADDIISDGRRRGLTYILALDADDAGRTAQAQLADTLTRAGVDIYQPDPDFIFSGRKDINAAWISDRDRTAARITGTTDQARARKNKNQGDSADPRELHGFAHHITSDAFFRDIDAGNAYTDITSGLENIDAKSGGLIPGLYCIAAPSSLGKTSLALQLAGTWASQGLDVIYFALEQGATELAAKTIARYCCRLNPDTRQTALGIRRGESPKESDAAARAAAEDIGNRLQIIDADATCNADDIAARVETYLRQTGATRCAVIVDYLQIIPAPPDRRLTSDKQLADYNISTLRRLARKLTIPVLAISAINRANYQTDANFAALKESGGIEYGCDVIWQLQLAEIRRQHKTDDDLRHALADAMTAPVRNIDLICLKNRHGETGWRVSLEYRPARETFAAGGF